ncbi:MAG: hypothetical protein IT270_17080 [Saprospiraceae bacterium]|nr:hypothetical protein [Saprospiraceae bacterium]
MLFLFTLFACNNGDSYGKNNKPMSNYNFLQDTNDSTKTTKQILDKYLPSVLTLSQVDSISFYYGKNEIEDDSIFRLLLIGKFVDQSKIFATEIDIKNNFINFFYLDKNSWKKIGSEKINIPLYKIEFEDLNGDDKNELVVSTFWNMNGNSWKEVFIYSDETNTIKYAGAFSTDFEVKRDRKQIEQTFEGSWYADNSKTLYEWRNEKLVPIKQIILAHDQPVTENGKLTFEYYENPTDEIKGLKLKFKERYHEDNKKQQRLWDNFFK